MVSNVRVREILPSFLATFFLVNPLLASPNLYLRKVENRVQVLQGKDLLYQVPISGKHTVVESDGTKRESEDEAFLAGRCLIVRRDVRPTELFPDVSELNIYRSDGSKKSYFEPDIIRHIFDVRVFTVVGFTEARDFG